MNRQELADLIFPDAKDISYYEEKYPERNLPEGAVVTRFAPSPTGFVHIGALEQCIVETSLVKKSGGVLILRIEDTDQKRKIENGVQGIIDSMKDFDIIFDEGMVSETESVGDYGPYIQTQRKEIYEAYAKYLLVNDRAYPCFATEEELAELRKKQEEAKLNNIGYYGEWAMYRDLPAEEAAERIKKGDKYVIRFKAMGKEDGRITHKDMVKGKVEMPQNIMDIVIIKGDGLPTYHFAHAVDDHLMHTTHVIRSSEWFPSVPLHLELFHSLGFKAPKYCHYAPMLKSEAKVDENGNVILDKNGEPVTFKRKISKRKDPEAAVSYYHREGIPAESVKEYLMTIANSDFEMWRKNNETADLYDFPFALKKMSTTEGALFDMDKLIDVSKNVIATFSAEKVYEDVYAWAERYDEILSGMLQDREYSLRVLGIERGAEIKKKRKDIGKWSDVREYISYMYDDQFGADDVEYEYQVISDRDTLTKVFTLYAEEYYYPSDDSGQWFDRMKDLAERIGYAREVKIWRKAKDEWPGHVGDVSTALRVGLTGRRNTPDLYQIMQVMGEDRVRARLKLAAERLS
ncbi:MAG: glutamate--tRNA ligase family protein [Clostridiales bacterium]|nr:glutamate--tRNA ligase family protein [Clostridiales bacterium]